MLRFPCTVDENYIGTIKMLNRLNINTGLCFIASHIVIDLQSIAKAIVIDLNLIASIILIGFVH